ncbi:MAG: thiamine biosynthesis protein ApbE [Pseudomonadota bacterium]|jgi:thiamine biosynthesis lipoprotein
MLHERWTRPTRLRTMGAATPAPEPFDEAPATVPERPAMTPPGLALRPMTLRPMARPQGGWMQREQVALGTTVSVQLWADDRTRGAAAMAAVMAEMQRIDRCCNLQRSGSELSLVNADAANGPARISDELFQLVARAQAFSRLTGGAFDITAACTGARQDEREGRLPDDIGLACAVPAIGWRNLRLDPMTPALHFTRPGVRIDLGGFARGHAVDRGIGLLLRHGIRHALVSAGGHSRMLGDRRGRPWTIAIRDPRCPDGAVALLPLQDAAVSDSGDCERFLLPDGVGRCHWLGPRTGHGPQRPRSVTVVAPDGLTAEALGKAVFVLGAERGLRLVEQQHGCDAVAISADGQRHCTPGFSALLQPVAEQARVDA